MKVGVFVKTFDVGYQLPTTNFLDEMLCKNWVNIYELTPNVVTKIIAFNMRCRSQGFLPSIWVFKNFFWFSIIGDKFTLYARKNTHVLVPDGRSSSKNWQSH